MSVWQPFPAYYPEIVLDVTWLMKDSLDCALASVRVLLFECGIPLPSEHVAVQVLHRRQIVREGVDLESQIETVYLHSEGMTDGWGTENENQLEWEVMVHVRIFHPSLTAFANQIVEMAEVVVEVAQVAMNVES